MWINLIKYNIIIIVQIGVNKEKKNNKNIKANNISISDFKYF